MYIFNQNILALAARDNERYTRKLQAALDALMTAHKMMNYWLDLQMRGDKGQDGAAEACAGEIMTTYIPTMMAPFTDDHKIGPDDEGIDLVYHKIWMTRACMKAAAKGDWASGNMRQGICEAKSAAMTLADVYGFDMQATQRALADRFKLPPMRKW